MENKKYLDNVIRSLVKGTKIDYGKGRIYTPFYSLPFFFYSYPFDPFYTSLPLPFSSYCKNTFGLTDDEILYVWKEYRNIILEKIEDGE